MIDDYEDNDRDEVKEQFKLNASQDEERRRVHAMNMHEYSSCRERVVVLINKQK